MTPRYFVALLCCFGFLLFVQAEQSSNGPNESSNSLNRTNYVIGGTNAERGQFPYQISLQIAYSYYGSSHTCGGTILKDRWILTAGHCVWETHPGRFLVKAGKNSLSTRENTEQVSRVARIFIHHAYRGGVGPFDIALLKLSTPLKFNNYVKPASLPLPNAIPHGYVMLSGWGSVSRSVRPIMPDILQKVMLPIVDIHTCSRLLGRLGAAGQLHNSNVCTYANGEYNVCSGDSGGPLVSGNAVIGVVSWGFRPCSMPGSPSVFVRVSYFNDWINNVVSKY